jgi:hypothetical protein
MKKSRVGFVNPNQSTSITKKSMKQLKVKGGGGAMYENIDRSPGGSKKYLEDNSMILTGGAPIESTIIQSETPAKKGLHYPSIHNV